MIGTSYRTLNIAHTSAGAHIHTSIHLTIQIPNMVLTWPFLFSYIYVHLHIQEWKTCFFVCVTILQIISVNIDVFNFNLHMQESVQTPCIIRSPSVFAMQVYNNEFSVPGHDVQLKHLPSLSFHICYSHVFMMTITNVQIIY